MKFVKFLMEKVFQNCLIKMNAVKSHLQRSGITIRQQFYICAIARIILQTQPTTLYATHAAREHLYVEVQPRNWRQQRALALASAHKGENPCARFQEKQSWRAAL